MVGQDEEIFDRAESLPEELYRRTTGRQLGVGGS